MSRMERSVLGAILINGQVYEQAAELRPDDFLLDAHRRIFVRMGDLVRSGRPIDIFTLVEELERHKELESVGGVGYVSGLMDGVPDRPAIQQYVKMTREAAARRRAARLGENLQRLAGFCAEFLMLTLSRREKTRVGLSLSGRGD